MQSDQFAYQQKTEEQKRSKNIELDTNPSLQCPKCGYIVDEGDLFCENCGCPLGKAETKEDKEEEAPATTSVQLEVEETKKEASPIPPPEKPLIKPLNIPGASKKKPQAKLKKLTAKTPELEALLQRSHAQRVKPDLPTLGFKESVEKVTKGWVCNFCGCYHSRPEECSRPDLGGVWQVEEVRTTVITKL